MHLQLTFWKLAFPLDFRISLGTRDRWIGWKRQGKKTGNHAMMHMKRKPGTSRILIS